jgi:hypothetical protein
MKIYEDITPALQAILRSVSTGNTCCWVSFQTHQDKLELIKEKWLESYGTGLSSEKRRYRKSHGLPTAQGLALPVLGYPHKIECVLLASTEALLITDGPFAREKWNKTAPEVSDFVMIKEPRERRDYAWTWRIQNRVYGLLEQHLTALIKMGDAAAVRKETDHWIRLYPLFGGVRRQLRRLLNGGRKLWAATQKSAWPGHDPDALPAMIGFRAAKAEVKPKKVSTRTVITK